MVTIIVTTEPQPHEGRNVELELEGRQVVSDVVKLALEKLRRRKADPSDYGLLVNRFAARGDMTFDPHEGQEVVLVAAGGCDQRAEQGHHVF